MKQLLQTHPKTPFRTLTTLLLLLLLTPRPLRATGILFGVLHVTSFTPNVVTHNYNLKSSYSSYLKSMYNDQPDQNNKQFKLPVEVHVYRKQRQDGTWHMQNYVKLPFPIYYDHMRAFKLKDKRCDHPDNNLYQEQINAQISSAAPMATENTGPQIDKLGEYDEPQTLQQTSSIFLKKHLTSVYEVSKLIKKHKQQINKKEMHKRCKSVSEGEGFVFIFDNPDSEGMMKIHSRKEPERIVPRHRLFYHLNQGLELYFTTDEHNDLVTRFDEGDMVGDMFGAILHTIKFPHLGHFAANFYIDRVERFDLDLKTQLKLVNKEVSDLSAEELEKMSYRKYHQLEVELEEAGEEGGEVPEGEDEFDLDYRVSDEDKLISVSLEQSYEGMSRLISNKIFIAIHI